jgi:hypothetical protein
MRRVGAHRLTSGAWRKWLTVGGLELCRQLARSCYLGCQLRQAAPQLHTRLMKSTHRFRTAQRIAGHQHAQCDADLAIGLTGAPQLDAIVLEQTRQQRQRTIGREDARRGLRNAVEGIRPARVEAPSPPRKPRISRCPSCSRPRPSRCWFDKYGSRSRPPPCSCGNCRGSNAN